MSNPIFPAQSLNSNKLTLQSMMLTKEEAICLILGFSDKNQVSSITKLNKLLARLNLYQIAVDIDFSLNKYGSYNAKLDEIQDSAYFTVEEYEYKGTLARKLLLKPEGNELFHSAEHKLKKYFTQDELAEIRERIHYLSTLSATEISDNEHKLLLVDVEDRFKLIQKVNSTYIDLKDLYELLPSIKEGSIALIKLKALIEFSYHLLSYLKNIRLKNLPEGRYDHDAYMFDYYFLKTIGDLVPFIRKQIKEEGKDVIAINRNYSFLINSVRGRYPFTLDNSQLQKLISH